MFSLNRIEIIGYQTQPVSLRQTPSGVSVTDLTVVVPYSFKSDKDETLTGKSFHTVTVWGSMAGVAGQYIRPGSQLYISGRLQTDTWNDEQSGDKRSKTKIVAMDLIMLDPKSGQIELPSGAELLGYCLNRVQVIGNLTRDPEMRTTTSGQHVLSFAVATNERWKDKASGELKERVEFHNVVAWADLALAVQQTVKKGMRIYVNGRVQTRSWETQAGQKRYTTEIVADQVSLLGVKNSEVLAAIQTDPRPRESAKGAPESAPAMTAAAAIPDISYESEIKPENLPF